MKEFIKSLANLAITSVTILSLIAIFYRTIDLFTGLLILTSLLFTGFISLIIYYFSRLDNKLNELEQKFKRTEDLIDIKADIKLLKLNKFKK